MQGRASQNNWLVLVPAFNQSTEAERPRVQEQEGQGTPNVRHKRGKVEVVWVLQGCEVVEGDLT